MSSSNQAFAALADPTRRQAFSLLASSGPTTATALSGELSISRQAVAKHLSTLAEAGLAVAERVGRETRYQADISGLEALDAWTDQQRNLWTKRLDRLADQIEPQRVVDS